VWLPQPLPAKDLEWLDTQCGEPMYVKTRPKRWSAGRYQQHIQLPQPTPAALRLLSECNGALMNYAEPALDWIFNDCEHNEHAEATVRQYVVKRHHREQQGVHTERATRYTAPRRSTSNLVIYSDRSSRSTGELDCTHIELRLRPRALQRAGLHTIKDLAEMDTRAFWEPRLILKAVDPEQVGRMYRVHVEANRKRNGICEDDAEVGMRLIRVCGGTTQEVIDKYRKRFNVGRCLVELDARHLLPEAVGMERTEVGNRVGNGVGNSEVGVNGRFCRRDNGIREVSDWLSPLIIEQRHPPTCTSSITNRNTTTGTQQAH
jgi:hypothetical protein